jgi:hypothetical protein
MDALAVLGTLTGLALTSGLRLYATVFVVGLGIRFGFFTPPPALASLNVLADTTVLAVAGGIYTLEFVADKIPWLDSIWDALHTFIRPLGAAALAATAIGDVHPAMKTAAALLCGGIALSSHTMKAGTRAVANHSPEPFSNLGLSIAEDLAVPGLVWLALTHPLITAAIVAVIVGVAIWLVPKLIRALRRSLAFVGSGFSRSREHPASRSFP